MASLPTSNLVREPGPTAKPATVMQNPNPYRYTGNVAAEPAPFMMQYGLYSHPQVQQDGRRPASPNVPPAPNNPPPSAPVPNNPANQGLGTFTTGITSGIVPQQAIDAASARMKQLPKFGAMAGGAAGGELMRQLEDVSRAQQAGANVDLVRNAAYQKNALDMQRQQAQANSGLAWGNLLARLNEDQMGLARQERQPFMQLTGGLLNQLLRPFDDPYANAPSNDILSNASLMAMLGL